MWESSELLKGKLYNMIEKFELNGANDKITLEKSGIIISASGFEGEGYCVEKGEQTVLSPSSTEPDEWQAAIEESGVEDRYTLTLGTPTTPLRLSPAGQTSRQPDELWLSIPISQDERAFLMYTDEMGAISFHAANADSELRPAPSTSSSALKREEFTILTRRVRGVGAKPSGFIGSLVSKSIRVLVIKVFSDQIGSIAEELVKDWESKNRPFEGLFWESPNFWHTEPSNTIDDFHSLRGRRSLVFVHGTFSTNKRTFSDLLSNGSILSRLSKAYEGRVLGFNHKTLSRGVAENVVQFFEQFRGHAGEYRLDLICHSRGGLVARGILGLSDEQISRLIGSPWTRPKDVDLDIGKVIFVATPNEGTVLAHPEGIGNFIDRLASYVNLIPDGMTSIAGGAILSLASSALQAGLPRIPGLADQAPSSAFQLELDKTQVYRSSFYAMTADYEPTQNITDAIADLASDSIFDQRPNDLVVPTQGVHEGLGIPAEHLLEFASSDDVHHGTFFKNKKVSQLVEWLVE